MELAIVQEDPGSAAAQELIEELSAALADITGDSGKSSFDPDDVRGPRARFLLARNAAGLALGCGALRPLHEDVAEIKRMYARPGHAGTGSALLQALEAQAQALGYRALWLETRLVNQRAVDFYAARGYRRIPNYGRYVGNPLAVCFEKLL
ncbi:GNAT family N-acetyltransferase [Oxalobacteraceae bacterium]|nr:GNAT family N-acetyltransferase [Oxalobacteraceae bacterium]